MKFTLLHYYYSDQLVDDLGVRECERGDDSCTLTADVHVECETLSHNIYIRVRRALNYCERNIAPAANSVWEENNSFALK